MQELLQELLQPPRREGRACSLVGCTAMRKGGTSGTPMKRAVLESTAGIVTAAGSNCVDAQYFTR